MYQNQSISVNPLFLYESFYPSVGIPQAQHLVAFFTINLNKLANEVELNLQRSEVDYAVWISKTDYEHILLRLEGQTPGIHFLNEVSPINYSQLFDLAPNSLGEGIAEGHKLALDIIFG